MLSIRNASIELAMKADGTNVRVTDLKRKTTWVLDEQTRYVSSKVKRLDHDAFRYERVHGKTSSVGLLGSGKAEKVSEREIRCIHRTRNGSVSLSWVLEKDRLRIFAEADIDNAASSVSLPGVFRPAGGASFKMALTRTQGFVHSGRGPSYFYAWYTPAFLSMCFYAQIAERSALLSILETDIDGCLIWEKTADGLLNIGWVHQPRFGELAYRRETVMTFTAPDITPVCKRYRDYEKEKGRFKTWDEKIAERANVAKLIGSVTAFVGYHQDPEQNYAANLRAMKRMGIERARILPILMGATVPFHYPMKGKRVDLIDLTRQVPLMHALGYSASGFIYITAQTPAKGARPYRNLMLGPDGKPILNWVMPDEKFYYLSLKERLKWAERYLDRNLKGCDGVHYDTLTANWLLEDWTPGRMTSAEDDYNTIREMMQLAGERNMYVAAEGFCGRLTPYYELGSTKYTHMVCRDEYYCVPLTMLVYHECASHIWWEVDNYNNPLNRSQGGRGWEPRYYFGAGYPEQQSAVDASAGTIPDIMPFGLQYTFVPKNMPDLFYYRFRMDEPALVPAVECAKRVQKLHRRIGKLEMKEIRILKEDGAIQETVFADGTRIVANFANTELEAPKLGMLPPESWTVVE